MKIGIDVSQIIYGTGVSVYTKELVSNLLEIDRENDYVLFGGSLRGIRELKLEIDKFEGKFEKKIRLFPPTAADFIWNRLHVVNFEMLVGKVDIYHSSDWTQAPSNAFKVATVHDLAPVKYPRQTPKKVREVHKRRLAWVKKEVDRIIVPTESVQEDLVELGFEGNRIKVIYEAVDMSVFKKVKKVEVDKMLRKLRVNEDYLLVVGGGARKNLDKTIKAFEELRAEGLVSQLVVVGNGEDKHGVKFVGRVSEGDLVALYNGAEGLVYASQYEGFGLPILEAMACNCPVVTSDRGAMSEVAGKAAVLVDPEDTESIAGGVKKVLKSREKYIKLGRKRVGDFSWDKTARETLQVYQEAV